MPPNAARWIDPLKLKLRFGDFAWLSFPAKISTCAVSLGGGLLAEYVMTRGNSTEVFQWLQAGKKNFGL